jgi:hypothetical protein
MSRQELPTNDGWSDVAYELGANAEDNAYLSILLVGGIVTTLASK